MNPLPLYLAEVGQHSELLIGNLALQICVAIGLLVFAAFVLFLELIVVSGGLLALFSVAIAATGCYLSYEVGPAMFWLNIIATPIAGIIAIRLGLKRLRRSSFIPQAEIDEDAGYAHVTEKLGIDVDAIGTLSTNAFPSGRARFTNGEIDVALRSGSGSKGERIQVIEIDGPCVYVQKIQSEQASSDD